MNYYAFIPLTAFIVNFFTLTYIVALKRKSPVNRAYLLIALSFAIVSMASFVSWSLVISWRLALVKGASITWIAFGFTFLNFTYAFLGKKRDTIYHALLASVCVFYAIALFTDLIISGFEQYYWGYYEKTGPLFIPTIVVGSLLPFFYCIGLLVKEKARTGDKQTKKQLDLLLVGAISLILVGIISDMISTQLFDAYHFLNFSTTGTTIQSLLIFRAVNKYNFLSIGVVEVANDLFNHVEDGIILSDNKGEVVQANKFARSIFNLDQANVPLKVHNLLECYDFNEDYKNYEARLWTRDTETIISLSQATVRQYDVELGKLLIIRDITETKRAEEALRQSKAQLELLAAELEQKVAERTASLRTSNRELRQQIDERKRAEAAQAEEHERLSVTVSSIGEGVITIDTQERVTLLNKVSEQLTGWSQESALGRPLRDVFRLLDDQRGAAQTPAVEDALHGNRVVNRARLTMLASQNGAEYLIAESGAPIHDLHGRVIGAVLVFRDMTERQKIEEELVKADRLESIGALAGGIAHDFNNILTAIMGNISLASMYAKEDEQIAKRLDNAERAALRAQDLTQQLLTFSKGGDPLKRLSSIRDLIQEAVDFSMRGSNVRCELALDASLWSADVDAGQISQVLHNLIINANQAMPNGGVLAVRAENAIVDDRSPEALVALKPGPYVKISIADEGCGIAEEQLQKIFDPYFTTKEEGNGLGLFTSYSIIKKHDGHIDVASIVDVGTTFNLYLPASEQLCDDAAAKTTRSTAGSGKILVMENEEEVCDVIEAILQHYGYDVVFAADGVEAIAAYRQAREHGSPFDAIIMDLTIPGGMGGKEAIERLRAFDPQVKAIVASGYANDPAMLDYGAHGFAACIAKPYHTDILRQTLQEVIG